MEHLARLVSQVEEVWSPAATDKTLTTETMPRARWGLGVIFLGMTTLVHSLFQLAVPIFSVEVMERVLPTGDHVTLVTLVVFALLVITADLGIEASRVMFLSRFTNRIIIETQMINAQRAGPIENNFALFDEMSRLRGILIGPIGLALLDFPATILFFGGLFSIHMMLGLTALVAATASLTTGYITSNLTAATTRKAAKLYASIVGSMPRKPPASPANRIARLRFLRMVTILTQGTGVIAEAHNTAAAINQAIRVVGQVSIISITGLLIVERQLGMGSMIASSLLFARAIVAVERCSDISTVYELVRLGRRMMDVRREPQSEFRAMTIRPVDGSIQVASASASHGKAGAPSMRDVSFTCEPGEVTIVLGPTASGKSTLLAVIAGLVPLSCGSVRINGFNLSEIDPDLISQTIGYLPDTPSLYGGSIAAIIAGDRALHAEAVVAAAKLAGIHDLILRTDGGYELSRRIDDLGWSRGQVQQLALARVFYGTPAVLLLDEPTAFLDQAAELNLLSTLEQLKRSKANILIVSSSPKVCAMADRVVYLRDGAFHGSYSKNAIMEHIRDSEMAG